VAVERQINEEPFHYSSGGVTLSTVRASAMYRVLCDRCERASTWSEGLPGIALFAGGRHGRYKPPHGGFYSSLLTSSHLVEDLCEDCFDEPVGRGPQEGSLWWSREQPRHVAKVVKADDQTTVLYVLYHPARIVGGSGEQPPKQVALGTKDFRRQYVLPMPDKEERQPGRVWASAQMVQGNVVVRSWGDKVVVEANSSTHTYPQPQFLGHFVPTTEYQCRTWLERLVADELV